MPVQGGIKAGKISKPYGLRGEVTIIMTPSVAKHIDIGTPLFIDLDGQRVPFFIEAVEKVSSDQAIAKLEFIDSVEEAKKVTGCDLYLDPDLDLPYADLEDELAGLVGYQVFDLHLGPLGRLMEYIPGEMNPVWIIDLSGKELMVPATTAFVKEIDRDHLILHLDLPEGISDL